MKTTSMIYICFWTSYIQLSRWKQNLTSFLSSRISTLHDTREMNSKHTELSLSKCVNPQCWIYLNLIQMLRLQMHALKRIYKWSHFVLKELFIRPLRLTLVSPVLSKQSHRDMFGQAPSHKACVQKKTVSAEMTLTFK